MSRLTETLGKLQDQSTSPGELSQIVVEFSAAYTFDALKLQDILTLKASKWPELRARDGCKSDKQADKAWDSLPEGIQEMGLRLQLKSYEKLMSAIKSHLRIKETEARNMF